MKKIVSLMSIASVLCLQAYSDGTGPYSKHIQRPSQSQTPPPRVQSKTPHTEPSRPSPKSEKPQEEQAPVNKPQSLTPPNG